MNRQEQLRELHLAMIELYRGDPFRIQHFCKVHNYCRLIGMSEGMDEEKLFVLETAALTHDIGIHYCEEHYGNCGGKLQEKEGPAIAKELLERLGFEEKVSKRVQYLIAHHHTYHDIDGMDYQILVEADFLVNLFEENNSKDGISSTFEKIFKTKTGKKICGEMFGMI